MIHTADLQRSKRMKELGWKNRDQDPCCRFPYQPDAGEMIEWLLKSDTCKIELTKHSVYVFLGFEGACELFEVQDGLCNALADACAWVLERKK